jgi:hypothetical protein
VIYDIGMARTKSSSGFNSTSSLGSGLGTQSVMWGGDNDDDAEPQLSDGSISPPSTTQG